MPIYDSLLQAASEAASDTAVEFLGRPTDYATLADQAQRVAGGLQRMDIARGDAIGLMLPNVPVFISLAYGSFMTGSVLVPLNVLSRPRELRHVITDSDLQAIVTLPTFVPVIEAAIADLDRPPRVVVATVADDGQIDVPELTMAPHGALADLAPNDHVLTLYTSGTTGTPKGAKLSDSNLTHQVTMMADCFEPQPGDRGLCVLPLFHAFALNCLLNMAIRYRITIVLQPKFEVEDCLRSLQHDDIAWFAGVPTMYAYLLTAAEQLGVDQLPGLRHCLTGGAAMPVEVLRAFEERFGVPVYEGYGLTETTVSVCSNRPGLEGRKVGSVGKPYRGVQMRVLDDNGCDLGPGLRGELVFRGANVMLGYLNQDQATDEILRQGWLHSGDIGYVDGDGFCFLVDRKKDVVIKSGYNVYPREIEDVIYALEPVAEVAVVGVPDPIKGEQLAAYVALRPGATLDEATLRDHVANELAKYKHPASYTFIDELPKAATGKILRRKVREMWDARNVPVVPSQVSPLPQPLPSVADGMAAI